LEAGRERGTRPRRFRRRARDSRPGKRRIITRTESDDWFVHDAFRLVLREWEPKGTDAARLRDSLRRALVPLLATARSPDLLLTYLDLALRASDFETVGRVVSHHAESTRDMGVIPQVVRMLEAALERSPHAPVDRFWILDALAFFDAHAGDGRQASLRLEVMKELLNDCPGSNERGAFTNKAILVHSALGDVTALRDMARTVTYDGSPGSRIAFYNLAAAVGHAGGTEDKEKALEMLDQLVEEYSLQTGLYVDHAMDDRLLSEALRRGVSQDDMRRLADCLDAAARFLLALQHPEAAVECVSRAVALYRAANATASSVKSAQDLADLLLRLGDRRGARLVLRTAVDDALAADLQREYVVARAQLAEVYAYLGDLQAVAALVAKLAPFATGSDPASAEVRQYLASAQAVVAPGPTDGEWYGGSKDPCPETDTMLNTHRGWTLVVGPTPATGEWYGIAKEGFFVCLREFESDGGSADLCCESAPTRDAAHRCLLGLIDSLLCSIPTAG
jgi:tetratricopeptide (TPR) repeat protein